MNIRLIIIINMALLLAAEPCFAQTWLPVGQGIGCNNSHRINDINITQDNSKILIAGVYNVDGHCEPMASVSSWNGSTLEQIAYHIGAYTSGVAFDFQNNTYASGFFVPQIGSYPLAFNTKTEEGIWDTVPHGYNGSAQDYTIRDGVVYLAGAFSTCNGIPCGLVCSYDGHQVQPYYTGTPMNSFAFALTFYKDTLYVGGRYTGLDGLQHLGHNKCCKIVNGQLEKVGVGFNNGAGSIFALAEFGDKLYMGGWVRRTGDDAHRAIYYYQNGELNLLPSQPDHMVTAMKAYNGGLYVAGDFNNIGNMPCNRIARWDGHEWTCLSNDMFYYQNDTQCALECVKDIEIWNDTLYIGGQFHRIGEDTLKRIAKLDMALSEAFPVKVTEQQRQELKLSVYPNPTMHELNITLPIGASAKDVIAVYDMHGRLLHEQVTGKYGGNIVVDLGRLSAGMYVLRYEGKEVLLARTFIKE